MAHSKRTRIIALVTALAACALFIDRVFLGSSLGGPGSAQGAEDAAPKLAGSGAGVRAPRPDAWHEGQSRLAARLGMVGDQNGLNPLYCPDGFAFGPAFRSAKALEAPVLPSPKPAKAEQAAKPPSGNSPSVVFTTPSGHTVIIEVRRLKVGDEYGGMKLVALEPDAAIFDGLGEHNMRVPFQQRAPVGEDDKVKVHKPGTAP